MSRWWLQLMEFSTRSMDAGQILVVRHMAEAAKGAAGQLKVPIDLRA